ncbi:MAG: adenylate/guanylate cyclase domain-containing protein [Desulfatiglandaceae bacterium]
MSLLRNIFGKSRFKPEEDPVEKPLELVIFFADVAGSTHLYENLGDRIAHECVVESLNSVSRKIKENNGVVVEVIGDEIMAYFENPLEAVNCACDLQKHFKFTATSHGHKINVRIGFHKGPIELDKGHPYGDTVNIAARIASLAKGGQIVTTVETTEGLPEYSKSVCRPFGRLEVKGKSNPLNTMEVVWAMDDATRLFIPSKMTATTAINAELVVGFGEKEIVITKEMTPYVFGRDGTSDLVVNAETASRSHAKIICRYGDFVFVDGSTNGTYINTAPGGHVYSGMEMHLHHREWFMIGDGTISLGKPISDDDPLMITFSLKVPS